MNFLSMLQSVAESGQTLANSLTPRTIETFASFALAVLAWSFVRPSMIRDYDNRALPNNATARVAFTLTVLVVFTSLALAYAVFIGAAQSVLESMFPRGDAIFGHFKGQPALLAFITLGGLLQFALFRDVERSVLIWLHSRRHASDDLDKLSTHLAEGPFTPTSEQRQRNRESIKRYGIYVTDEGLDAVGLVTFSKWRKTSTLLRLVREWNGDAGSRVLGDDDLKLLDDLETSHDRKTELAMTILKMIDEVQEHHSGEAEKALGSMLQLLTNTPHVDRDGVVQAEVQAKALLTLSMQDLAKKQVRLTSEQLRNRIGQIERYFDVEYELMLEQVSLLAARSVVLSGEKANDRLDALKAVGFGGLGSIQQLSVDRILWIFLAVSLGSFVVLYLGWSKQMAPGMAEGLARFSIAMAIAAMIGAIIGSRRRYSQIRNTPWMKYLTGGALAGGIFVLVSVLWNAIKVALDLPPPEGLPPFSIVRTLIWAILPAVTTIAIARLARLPHWPAVGVSAQFEWLYVRALDGLVVSLIFYAGWALAFPLHDLLGLELSRALLIARENSWVGVPVFWTLQLMSFMIGFMVVKDVRLASHATIILPVAQQATPPPTQAKPTLLELTPEPARKAA